jgi:hypothetical protein
MVLKKRPGFLKVDTNSILLVRATTCLLNLHKEVIGLSKPMTSLSRVKMRLENACAL